MLATPELILEAAQSTCPAATRPRWQEFPIYQTETPHSDLPGHPVIGKRELRTGFPGNFLRPGQDLAELLASRTVELEHTSGSSDERMAVLFGRGWWNEQEARVLRLNPRVARVLDTHPQARRATLVPPICNGLVCFSNWTSRAARTVGDTLFVNQARIPFLLDDSELSRMAGEILDWAPVFLDLDPVHGSWFALYCERQGIRFPSVQFVLSSYEFVSVVHRRILERVLNVPVFNFYGSTETGHLLMEDQPGEMRACLENAEYEILDPDERGVGDLVVTTLTNEFMPLRRYRIGDLVQRSEQPYTTRYRMHGRARDTLSARDGQRVTTLDVDECFAGVGGFAHYQFSQATDGSCRLKFIPDGAGPDPEALDRVTVRLVEQLRLETRISIEAVTKLPPLPSGKFRLTQRV